LLCFTSLMCDSTSKHFSTHAIIFSNSSAASCGSSFFALIYQICNVMLRRFGIFTRKHLREIMAFIGFLKVFQPLHDLFCAFHTFQLFTCSVLHVVCSKPITNKPLIALKCYGLRKHFVIGILVFISISAK
jgi:hypothetical protein